MYKVRIEFPGGGAVEAEVLYGGEFHIKFHDTGITIAQDIMFDEEVVKPIKVKKKNHDK